MNRENGLNTSVKDFEGLAKEVLQLDNNISSIKSEFIKTNQFTETYTKEIKSQINKIFSTIDKIQKCINNLSAQYSQEIQSLSHLDEEARKVIVQQYQKIQERLERINDKLEGNRQDLLEIREPDLEALASESTVSKIQIDLEAVKTRANKLPTSASIKQDLLENNNEQVTQKKLSITDASVSYLKKTLKRRLSR
jgi:uncharacterized coiled-coil DUF342 family protein